MPHKNDTLETAGVEGSHDLHIKTLKSPVGDLKRTDFQKKEGHKIFEWLMKNLPNGVYDNLYQEMKQFEQM